VVVANADAAQVAEKLLPQGTRHSIPARDSASMSGSTAILRAARRSGPEQRVAHTGVFPDNYEREHADIFDKQKAPEDPTVYLCAQEVCHQVKGWPDHEPVFMMCNAPALSPDSDESPSAAAVIEKAVEKLRAVGLIEKEDEVVWKRTPKGLADAFLYTQGSIYGAASNTRMAAFKRPPNKVRKIPGLYLASGSAHPGGGLPLCALSGMIAARCALVNLNQ
jgi:phytoene dehydrogenase-like protein